VEGSAKSFLNIADLFYSVQRIVLHPTPPLYDIQRKEPTTKFIKALRLIFRLNDKDRDFILSDSELNEMHIAVYNSELILSDIDGIKSVVSSTSSNGVVESGFTFEGFVAI
jgi:hypothetical protein